MSRALAEQGHWTYFAQECASLGREMTEEAPVVLERFALLYADAALVREPYETRGRARESATFCQNKA